MSEPPYWPPPPDWRPDPDQPAPKPPAGGWTGGVRERVTGGLVLGLSLAAVATAYVSWRAAWNRGATTTSFDTTIWLLLVASAVLLGSAITVSFVRDRITRQSGGILIAVRRAIPIALLVGLLWFGIAAFFAWVCVFRGNTG